MYITDTQKKYIPLIAYLLVIAILVGVCFSQTINVKADTIASEMRYYKFDYNLTLSDSKYDASIVIGLPNGYKPIAFNYGNAPYFAIVDDSNFFQAIKGVEVINSTATSYFHSVHSVSDMSGLFSPNLQVKNPSLYNGLTNYYLTLADSNNVFFSTNIITNVPSGEYNIANFNATLKDVPTYKFGVALSQSLDLTVNYPSYDNADCKTLDSPIISYSDYGEGLVDFYTFTIDKPSTAVSGCELDVTARFANTDNSKSGVISIPNNYCSGACKKVGLFGEQYHTLEIKKENEITYGGFTLCQIDISDYVGQQIGNDVQITNIIINARFVNGSSYSKWSNYNLDLVSGKLMGSVDVNNEKVEIDTDVNTGGSISSNTADNKNSLQAIVDWFTSSLSDITTNIGKVFSNFLNLFSYVGNFFSKLGELYTILLGSDLGTLITISMLTVCLLGILKAVKG